MNDLRHEFKIAFSNAWVDGKDHYFIVPRRMGTTTLLKNLSNAGKGTFKELKEVDAESITLDNGSEIIIGSGCRYQKWMNSLETEASKHVYLLE